MTEVKQEIRNFVEDIFKEFSPEDCISGEIPYGTEVWYKNTDTKKCYKVKITDGNYWGTNGLSNFWYFTNLETGEQEHGYGNFYTKEQII